MKKVTLVFLVATLILAPVLAAAQTGGSPSGTLTPAGRPSDKPKGVQSSGEPTAPRDTPDEPAASPTGVRGSLYWVNSKADCVKAGGKWGEVSQSCSKE